MLTFKDDDVKRQIEEEVGIRPAFATDLAADVKQSIARIKASPFIPPNRA
jgi:carbonic anhydrase